MGFLRREARGRRRERGGKTVDHLDGFGFGFRSAQVGRPVRFRGIIFSVAYM